MTTGALLSAWHVAAWQWQCIDRSLATTFLRAQSNVCGTLGAQDIMRDPVTCADGHSYERSAIEDWCARCYSLL